MKMSKFIWLKIMCVIKSRLLNTVGEGIFASEELKYYLLEK